MELTNLADIAAKSSFARPDATTGAGLAAKEQNIDEYKNATKPTLSPDPAKDTTPSPKDRVAPKARYGARPGEKRIDTKPMTKPLGSFEKGTSHVPKTGIYKLHEGEAVIPKDKNMDSMKDKMTEALGGSDKKPKKEIKEMHIRKTANGKHIVTHKHHHPEHHPDEEHSMENMAALHQHMEDHAGTPNEGEGAESAAPAGAAQMTAAPSPAAPAPAAGGPAGM
jgi:hypothetical protein